MNAAARFLAALKNCHENASKAYDLMETMPETGANQTVALEGLIQHFNLARGADYSLVLQFLDEALEALLEVRSYTEEELSDFCREHMVGDRREAA